MKKTLYATLAVVGLFSIPNAHANNLNSLINQEVKAGIKKFSSRNDEYTLLNKNIIYADINSDGKKDAVVRLDYCEKTSCHNTTNVFTVAIFLNTGKNYRFADRRTLGMDGDLKITNGTINVTTYEYSDSDPTCCPSLQKKAKFKMSKGKLVKIQ